jgi:putative Holliday junction resolvase
VSTDGPGFVAGGIPRQGRVLGIDPGERRIGIAVSNEDRTVATPLEVVTVTEAFDHRRRIGAIAAEWEVVGLVVGLPRHLDGREGTSAEAARAEGDALGDTTGLPVAFYDERLTSVTAERSLTASGVPASKQRGKVDMLAAAVLLQAFLDSTTETGE